MATTAGYVEVGPGKTFTTWSALIADLDDLTGHLSVMQTGTTSEPGTAFKAIDLNGYTLTFDSDNPHLGIVGAGHVCQVLSNPGTPIIRLEANGTGTFEVKNLQVDEAGLTDAESAFSLVGYSGSVDIKVHDLIAIGSTLDVGINGVIGVAVSTLNGDLDMWNIKSYDWNDVCIGVAPGYFGSGSGRIEDCTAYYAWNYGIYNFGSFFAGGGIVRNCVAVGSGAADFDSFNVGGYVGNNNASSDATAADGVWSGGGSGNNTGINPSEFKSLVRSSPDFLMVAAGGVLEAGGSAVLIPENTLGIRGNDRPHSGTLYSIGADEFGEVGPGPTPSSSSSSSSSGSPTPDVTAETGDAAGTNLGRSLLLNVDGAQQTDTSFFGYEYASPSYRPVPLPSGLLNVRRMLFGSTPDMAGMNYSAWQYMRILHSTEFEAYLTALDPRITYLNNKSLVDYPYGPVVSENDDALQFAGAPDLGDASGRLTAHWRIEQTTPTSYRIYNYRTGVAVSHTPTIVDGVTEYMPMTGHPSFKVRVIGGFVTQPAWEVEYLAKPTSAMDPINRAAQLSKLSAETYLELFPRRDPYNLFRELWEKHQEFAYKMSGALLALIYRTAEIRNGG